MDLTKLKALAQAAPPEAIDPDRYMTTGQAAFLRAASPVAVLELIALVERQEAELTAVYDLFGVGSQARYIATLTTSIRNVLRFADMLHAVEREFFMVPGEPDEDFPDEEPQDECLLNCWGSTEAQYVEQFRAALAKIATTPQAQPALTDAQPVEIPAPVDLIGDGAVWDVCLTGEQIKALQQGAPIPPAKHPKRIQSYPLTAPSQCAAPDERAAFETWAKSDDGGCWDGESFLLNESGTYQTIGVRNEWEAFQAGRASLAAQPSKAKAPKPCAYCGGKDGQHDTAYPHPSMERDMEGCNGLGMVPDRRFKEGDSAFIAIGKIIDHISQLQMLWGLGEPGALIRYSEVINILFAASKAVDAPSQCAAPDEREEGRRDGLREYAKNMDALATRAERAEESLATLVEGVEGLKTYERYEPSWQQGDTPAVDEDFILSSDLLALLPAKAGTIDTVAAYQPGRWFDARTIDEMQEFYMSRLPAIRIAAQEHGYAIGLHGSARRDFDLIAMQWRDGASDKDSLARAIADAACGIRRDGSYDWEKKPNGRVATSIPICWTAHANPDFDNMISAGHIDLSIIDQATPAPTMGEELPSQLEADMLNSAKAAGFTTSRQLGRGPEMIAGNAELHQQFMDCGRACMALRQPAVPLSLIDRDAHAEGRHTIAGTLPRHHTFAPQPVSAPSQPVAAATDRVAIPGNADQAALMVLLGTQYLQQYAPERLKAQPVAAQVELTVWEGAMPESNGKTNFTALLHRKGDKVFDMFEDGFTIDRSEYPDRVRYEADRVRYLIGEITERPCITKYDADKHSGYTSPPPAPEQRNTQGPLLIARIKRYRQVFGCTLAEAKDACEHGRDLNADQTEFVSPPAPVAAPAAAPLYTCVGKGGEYELIGTAKGAGVVSKLDNMRVYRSTKGNGQLYYRTSDDFDARMARIAAPSAPVGGSHG